MLILNSVLVMAGYSSVLTPCARLCCYSSITYCFVASYDNILVGSQSLGMLAMCCINELLSKNCVPADFESYLLQLFQQTFYLLKKMTQDNVKTLDALDTA